MVTPIETFIIAARDFGIMPVLLWLLTLAIVWGLLQHANVPKSVGARGVISICAAFLVLVATAATAAGNFIQTIIIDSVLIAVGLLVVVMFLEVAGVKLGEGKTIFQGHPKFFGAIIIILVVSIFISAGIMSFIHISAPQITESVLAFLVFMAVVIAAIYIMMQETGAKKEK